jgi:hypothetical protein
MTGRAPLTSDEEVTLRRVAYGQSDVRAMRRQDLERLRALDLIKESKDGPVLTAAGKHCFDRLPKAMTQGGNGPLDTMLRALGRNVRYSRR